MLLLSIGTLAGYALVISLHYRHMHDGDLLWPESLHWLVLALALPGFVILTGRVQRLHGALQKAGMKIKNIEESARRDALTDCYNRRYMVFALEEQKRLADENGTPLCLAVIDLDHFKRINDEVGHLAGDDVLRTFARVAQDNIRQGDIFGRYGGEEFLLLLPETELQDALNTAERIREQIENYHWSGKLQGLVTVSIGITQYIAGESVLDLFARTDTAMYRAKRGGRNQVVVEQQPAELWQTAVPE
jgi:diguanylate cyclase (GGDEF)-like protein